MGATTQEQGSAAGGVTTVTFNQENGSVTIQTSGNSTGALASTNSQTFAAADAPAEDDAPGGRWDAVLAVEGHLTEDGRIIDPGALSWRELPLTLMGMRETSAMGGHDGAFAVGRIDEIERVGPDIVARGVWSTSEDAQAFRAEVEEKIIRGVSVDLAILDFELRDEDGNVLDDAQIEERFFSGEPIVYAITDAVIGMATVCPFQAIEGADIEIVASGFRGSVIVASGFGCDECQPIDVVVTASAALMAPDAPPAAWFDDPKLSGLTPLTVTDDGRVFGHLADWNVCHTGRANECLLPPRGADYSFFHAGLLRTADGVDVHVGQITMDTLHASTDPRVGPQAVRSHYDHTGVAIADVRIGEDSFGPWIAGAIRPDADAAKVRALRAGGKVSGDWRTVNGKYALVAALAVNVPGFPIPRATAVVSEDGGPLALVASGIVVEASISPGDDAARQAKLRALAARAEGGVQALARLAG